MKSASMISLIIVLLSSNLSAQTSTSAKVLAGEDPDFSVYTLAVMKWFNVTDFYRVQSLSYVTFYESGVMLAVDKYFSAESDWEVVEKVNYNNIGLPYYYSRSAQAPAKYSFFPNGAFWIKQKSTGVKSLISVSSNYLSVYFNSDDASSLAVAEKLKSEIVNLIPSFYRGKVLQFQGGISFFEGVDDLKAQWSEFIFEKIEKDRLIQTIDGFLKNYSTPEWKKYGLPTSRGVLLYGPPGTGKSYIAQILSTNVLQRKYPQTVSYIHVQARHLMYASQVQDLYMAARDLAPSVVFIEDIDLIAGTDRDDRQDIKNELMQQLSGVQSLNGVITIGTTNVFEKIDPALTRSKRLGFHFNIGLPSYNERIQLVQSFTNKDKKVDINPEVLASLSEGLSGADLKLMVDLAREKAIREKSYDPSVLKIVLRQSDLAYGLEIVKGAKK